MVRKIAAAVLVALVTGVALGAVSRLLMRLVSLAAGHDGDFSWSGTAGIIVVFVVATLPGAVLAALVRRRGRSLLLVAGAVLLCVMATGITATDLGSTQGLSPSQWVAVAVGVAGIYAAILALPVTALTLLGAVSRSPRLAARLPGSAAR